MNRSRVKWGMALALVGTAGVASGIALSTKLDLGGVANAAPTAPVTVTPAAAPGPSFVNLAKQTSPAVVNINVKVGRRSVGFGGMDPFGGGGRMPQGEGAGTGFFISADGYILTNDHVVGQAESISVALADGREYTGKVIGTDSRTDIALIKVEDKKPFVYLKLGDSDRSDIGEWVVAIGNPFGLHHTVTAGIISAKGRRNIAPSGRRGLFDFIQTDASINPGNSGGPLLNLQGEVIGINSAVNAAGQGIGFAIPINMAKTLLPNLKDHGKVQRSYLGVQIQDLSRELAKSLKLPDTYGAIVNDVVAGSPAEKAGLKRGDVVVSFDGKPVKDAQDLTWAASTAGTGKAAVLGVVGPNGRRDVKVTLAELPGEPTARSGARLPAPQAGRKSPVSGLEVTKVTAPIARQLGLDEAIGVAVTHVDRDSAAAGILARGDVILAVDDEEVNSERELEKALSGRSSGDAVRILVLRGGATLWLAFTL